MVIQVSPRSLRIGDLHDNWPFGLWPLTSRHRDCQLSDQPVFFPENHLPRHETGVVAGVDLDRDTLHGANHHEQHFLDAWAVW